MNGRLNAAGHSSDTGTTKTLEAFDPRAGEGGTGVLRLFVFEKGGAQLLTSRGGAPYSEIFQPAFASFGPVVSRPIA